MSTNSGPVLGVRVLLSTLAVVLPPLLAFLAFFLGVQETRVLRQQRTELDLAASILGNKLSGLDLTFAAVLKAGTPPEFSIAVPVETGYETRLIEMRWVNLHGPYLYEEPAMIPPPVDDDNSEITRSIRWHVASRGRANAHFVFYLPLFSGPSNGDGSEPSSEQHSLPSEMLYLPVPLELLLSIRSLPGKIDGAVLMTGDGRVLYQAGLSDLAVSGEDLLPMFAQSPQEPLDDPLSPRSARAPKEVATIEISGSAYRPLLSRVDLTSLEAGPADSSAQELYLCAFLQPSTIRWAAIERVILSILTPGLLILVGIGIAVFWKVREPGSIPRLPSTGVSLLMRTTLLTASSVTLFILHHSYGVLPQDEIDRILQLVGEDISSEFRGDLEVAVSTLNCASGLLSDSLEDGIDRLNLEEISSRCQVQGRIAIQGAPYRAGSGRWRDSEWYPEEPLPSIAVNRGLLESGGPVQLPLPDDWHFTPYGPEIVRVRTAGTGLFVTATYTYLQLGDRYPILVDESTPLLALDSYFGSLISPALPAPAGMAVIDRSGDVLYHSEGQRVLVENFIAQTSGVPNLDQAIETGYSGVFSALYRGSPHRLLLRPFETVPWTLVVFWDQTFLGLHSSLRLAVTLALLVLYVLLMLLVGQILRIMTPKLRWSWNRLSQESSPLRPQAWYSIVLLAGLSLSAILFLDGWFMVVGVTATAITFYVLMMLLSSERYSSKTPAGRHLVYSEANELAPVLEVNPATGVTENSARLLPGRIRAFRTLLLGAEAAIKRQRLFFLLSLTVLLIAVLPTTAMFREAQAAVTESVAFQLQLNYAGSVLSRIEGIRQAQLVTGEILSGGSSLFAAHDGHFQDRTARVSWWPMLATGPIDLPNATMRQEVFENPRAPGMLMLSWISPRIQNLLASSSFVYDWYRIAGTTYVRLPGQDMTVCSGEGCSELAAPHLTQLPPRPGEASLR